MDIDFGECIPATADGVDPVVKQLRCPRKDAFDCIIDGFHAARTGRCKLGDSSVFKLQLDRCSRDIVHPILHLHPFKTEPDSFYHFCLFIRQDAEQIIIHDFFFLICKLFERVKCFVQLFIRQLESELRCLILEGMTSGVLSEDEAGRAVPDQFRCDDFVGGLFFQHAVLMDPGLVGKGIIPDDGFVCRYPHARKLADKGARLLDFIKLQARPCTVEIFTDPKGDGDFFKGCISCPLSDSVDRPFDLIGSVFDRCQGVGRRHPQVVMTMGGELDSVDIRNILPDIFEDFSVLLRRDIADRIGKVDDGCSCIDDFLHDPDKEIKIGTASILCRPLDDGEELFRIFHGLDRCFNDLVRRHLELMGHVDRRCS